MDETLNTPVLLIFFNRPQVLKKVFDRIREVRPTELYLFQDGPRKGNSIDILNIQECRKIVNEINWNCNVHRRFEENNHGADEAGYIADTWAFETAHECIILEDDVLPSKSFFYFCQEMLAKYRNEDRVMMISGFNPTEIYSSCDNDYFFTAATLTWGWATWKRVAEQWNSKYEFLSNPEEKKKIEIFVKEKGLPKNSVHIFENHRNSGIIHWETIVSANQYLHNGLSLIPKKNMISNIGVTSGATHYTNDLNLIPKGYRKIFTMQQFDIEIKNLKCPRNIKEDPVFIKKVYRILGWGHPWVKVYRFIEGSIYQIVAGNIGFVVKDFKSKAYNVLHRDNT